MAAPTPHISLQVRVFIAPENVPKFLEAFKPVLDKVRAEPLCTSFQVFQDPESPGSLSWVENWNATAEWLWDVQIRKDYYTEYFAVTEPMFIQPREIKILNVMDL